MMIASYGLIFDAPFRKDDEKYKTKLKIGFLKSYGALRTFMQNNPMVWNKYPLGLSRSAVDIGHQIVFKIMRD
jgi:hypothetical protein